MSTQEAGHSPMNGPGGQPTPARSTPGRSAAYWTMTVLSCCVASAGALLLSLITLASVVFGDHDELWLALLLSVFGGAYAMLRRGYRPSRDDRRFDESTRAGTGLEQWLRAVAITVMLSSVFFVLLCTAGEMLAYAHGEY